MKPAALVAVAFGGAAVLWLLLLREQHATTTTGEDEAEQDPDADPFAAAWYAAADAFIPTPEIDENMAQSNLTAFLRMIRTAEGTAGPNGYRTRFGGALFDDMSDHPRIAVQFRDKAGQLLWTSAAGAYQFLAVSPIPGGSTRVDTWDRLKRRLSLPDFSPESQDAAAVELIREAGALGDVRAGRFDAAVSKVRGIWASLPGAGYSQPERSLSALRAAYLDAGGRLA